MATSQVRTIDHMGVSTDAGGLDINYGAQNGANLALGMTLPNGTQAQTWINSTPHITQQVIPFLMEPPAGFDLYPNSTQLKRDLKEIIENWSTTINGITIGLTAEKDQTPVGRSGQQLQEVTKVTATLIEPQHEFKDLLGTPIHNFWYFYFSHLLGDKDTGIPLCTLLPGYSEIEYALNMKSFTVLYVVPDIAHKRAVTAVLQTNMIPDTTGEIEHKKDLTAPGETVTFTINFGGLSQTSKGVVALGTKMLQELLSTKVDPSAMPAFMSAVDPDIAALNDVGYNKTV